MLQFIKTNREMVDSLVGVATLAIAVIGFGLTVHQLSLTQRALKAANAYQIQTDARELVESIQASGALEHGFLDDDTTGEKYEILSNKLWIVFNFYLAVYRQAENKGVTSEFAESFRTDFCAFVKREIVELSWKEMSENRQLGAAHEGMKDDWCD